MTIKNIIVNGIRYSVKNIKFLILFWVTNASLAFLLSIPIYSLLLDNLNHSIMSDELALGFDYSWYIQFMSLYKNAFEQIPLVIYGVVGIYALVNTFYFGGLVAVFHQQKKNHISDFFYGGVKFWLRFFKVLLIALFLFAAVFKLNDLSGDLIDWAFRDTENALTDAVLRTLRYVFLIFFIGIITLISDYTRIHLAVDDKQHVFKGIKTASFFIKNNFRIVFSVFLIISCFGALGSIVYNIVEVFIPRTPYYFLLLSFIVQQMLIIFRLLIRMLFCSTEVIIYKDLSADVISVQEKNSVIEVSQ